MLAPSIFGRSFVDSMFDDFFEAPFWETSRPAARSMMNTDITESKDGYQIEMDLPGFAKEDVSAALKDGYLTIAASHNADNEEKDSEGKLIRRERYQGTCQRSFYVGEEITEEDIKAKFENGILKLYIPKKDAKTIEQNKYISIEG